ncbi:molybdopterin-binding protein [Paratractidigestivibacter sp.]|uniref:molybdopterin-binding protein n=1 Tax=Paratractidigestivibacter sp. TaxID=2847316 RepID=UPI002AC95529|nr:molybdopterin-binding protein [Paratractidigestivibacter sp.]
MKLIRTEDAVGQVLCQDMTQIIPGKSKGPRFKKGHVVTEEDIPVLLSMGKVNLYVWEMEPGMVHENDAAHRLAALCLGPGTVAAGEPSEGKINIKAATDGVLLVNTQRLNAVNATDEVMVATRKGGFAVREGEALAGTRVIPLVVHEEVLLAAEAAAAGEKLLEVQPFVVKTAAVIATGSEVACGLIEDAFTPVMVEKLAAYGIEVTYTVTPGDEMDAVVAAINEAHEAGAELVLCTGGMSVDPDDNTPGAIKRAGARIVTYGSPVLPGAMLLVGYFDENVAGEKLERPVPVLGVPGCAMYNKATVLDLVLPRVAAGVPMSKQDFVVMGEGGFCLGCKPCTFPICPFGK